MLDNIVSILVLHKRDGAAQQLLEDGSGLLLVAVFQNPLDNSASVWVSCEGVHLSGEGIHDELDEMRWYFLDALLDDVVAVLVLDALHYIALEFLDELSLLVYLNNLKCLLDHSASVHLHREVEDMASELVGENATLLRCTVLEELLNYIVSKHIDHQYKCRWQDLVENKLLLCDLSDLQFLLDKSGSMLVTAELDDVSHDVLQLKLLVLIVAELLQ